MLNDLAPPVTEIISFGFGTFHFSVIRVQTLSASLSNCNSSLPSMVTVIYYEIKRGFVIDVLESI